MRKAAITVLMTAVLIFTCVSAQALVCDLANRQIAFCDNFGRVWNLTIDKGEIRGFRDMTDPNLECGLLPVYGTICCPQNKVRLTVLNAPNCSCRATYWEGQFTSHALDAIEGQVYNGNGLFGDFTLTRCSSEPEMVSDIDPATP